MCPISNHLEQETQFWLWKDFKLELYQAGANLALEDKRSGGNALIPNEKLSYLKSRLDQIIQYTGKTRDKLKVDLYKWKSTLEIGSQRGIEKYLEHLFPPTGIEKE